MRTFADRYVAIGEAIHQSGLSEVFSCADTTGAGNVAVKLLKGRPDDDETMRLLFTREVESLRELRHPNIVQLLDAGVEPDSGRCFLVLEWLPDNLVTWLERQPDTESDTFVDRIAVPLLEALAFAHERTVVHRDIKPSNILVSQDGTPKLADFGISKILRSLSEVDHTLAHFSSRPYAPPDAESKSSYSRDVFAFGVLLLTCLSAKPIEDYEDFPAALDALEADFELLELIERCVSLHPSDRPRNASELLLSIQSIQGRQKAHERRHRHISLALTNAARRSLAEGGGSAESAPEQFVVGEFADSPAFKALLEEGETSAVFDRPWLGERRRLFVFGDEWGFQLVAEEGSPQLAVISATRTGSITNDEQRDRYFVSNDFRFSFAPPPDYAAAEEDIRALVDAVLAFEGNRTEERKARERARLFEQWRRQLSAREAQEEKQEDRLAVTVEDQDGHRLVLRLPDAVAGQGLEGEPRVLLDDTGRRRARGAVEAVEEDRLTLYLESLPRKALPVRGFLAFDTGASRSKMQREREALGRVRFASSLANPDLPKLLVDPKTAEPVATPEVGSWVQDRLDDHKKSAVAHALASPHFTVVHGPPGTGKTTFIAELVAQELRRSPDTRILLTSQTHVAVDNALKQIRTVTPDARLLRVGRQAQGKIAPDVIDLSVEEQLQRWRREVQANSSRYLEDLVAQHGLDVETVRRSYKLGELAEAVGHIRHCDAEIAHRAGQLRSGIAEDDVLTDEARAEVEAEVSKLRDARDERLRRASDLLLDASLRSLGLPGSVGELDELVLADRANAMLPEASASGLDVRRLVHLQSQWVDRINSGTEFEAALVVSSQLVAGTCVGIAGATGIDDKEFDLCIVDEASKATATETLVPLVRAKRWVLVGDEQQLPPFLDEALRDAEVQEEFGLDPLELRRTLFGRLADGLSASGASRSLNRQYRMVPAIGDLISSCFYRGELESEKREEYPFTAALQEKAACWLATDALPSCHERATESGSYLNLCEAREVMRHLRRLDQLARQAGLSLHVLVLAPYAAQVRELDRRAREARGRLPSLQLEVNTVDAAQGREADAVVFSAVRSNAKGRIGFVREAERANVALSRGRFLLTIVGDATFFDKAGGPLSEVLKYMRLHPSTCAVKEVPGGEPRR